MRSIDRIPAYAFVFFRNGRPNSELQRFDHLEEGFGLSGASLRAWLRQRRIERHQTMLIAEFSRSSHCHSQEPKSGGSCGRAWSAARNHGDRHNFLGMERKYKTLDLFRCLFFLKYRNFATVRRPDRQVKAIFFVFRPVIASRGQRALHLRSVSTSCRLAAASPGFILVAPQFGWERLCLPNAGVACTLLSEPR